MFLPKTHSTTRFYHVFLIFQKVQVIRKRNITNFMARLETFMKSIRRNSDYQKNMTPNELKNFKEFVEPEITMFLVTLDVHSEFKSLSVWH